MRRVSGSPVDGPGMCVRLLVATGLLLPSTALAQSAGAPAPAAPSAAAASPAPASTPAPAASPAPVAPAPVEDTTRFRWGIWPEGGPYFFGGSSGGAGGVTVRMGAHINDSFGVYGQAIGLVGGGASVSSSSTAASGLVVAGLSAMGELTLANHFFVAVGPEMIDGTAGAASSNGSSASALAAAGAFFAIDARLGAVLGSARPEHRGGFSLGVDMHTIFTPGGAVVAPMIGLGYDSY